MTTLQNQSPTLTYDVFALKRPGLTRDLPPGTESLQWVANTATLIAGSQDAVLGDTFATIDQNRQLVDWMKKSGKNSIGRIHSVAEGLAELGKRMSGVEDSDSFWQEGTAARGAGEPPGLFRSRLRDFE